MDGRRETLCIGLARYARLRVERRQADAQHRHQERWSRRRERGVLDRPHDAGKCRRGRVRADMGGHVPYVRPGGGLGHSEEERMYMYIVRLTCIRLVLSPEHASSLSDGIVRDREAKMQRCMHVRIYNAVILDRAEQ